MTRLSAYITGYALSIIFTLIPLAGIWWHAASSHGTPSHGALYGIFIACALLQLFVQLYFFLHMGEEKRPRWNLMALWFAAFIVVVVVGGTLWIMQHLEHQAHGQVPFEHGVVTPQTQD